MVIFPGAISVYKRQEFHKRTTSRYKGGTVAPLEGGTRVVPSYLVKVQGWYRHTSHGTAVPPAGRNMVPSCVLELRLEVHYPLPPNPSNHTQPQLILNAQQTSIQGEHLVWVSPLLGRETAPNCQNVKEPKSLKIKRRYRGTSAKTTLLETTLLGTGEFLQKLRISCVSP